MITEKERNKALNAIIVTQCFGQVAGLCFMNGLLFNYLIFLDFSEQSLVLFLRLPSLIALFTTLPLAYLSDIKGKSKLGQIGNFIQTIGMICLCAAAYISGYKVLAVVIGVVLFSIGTSLLSSSWFALLDPIIPKALRGPFFAKLRTIWQLFGVTFTFVAQVILERNGDTVLAPILMCVALFIIVRMYFYKKIPELEVKEVLVKADKLTFMEELKKVVKHKDYFRYCLFMLFLPFGISCLTLIYNLYEKSILNFSSADIVLMGNLALIGGIVGFVVGALGLKKLGEKGLFIYCSCCISLCSLAFPLHGFCSIVPVKYYVGFVTFCTGLSVSALSIGMTSLMLHLLPKDNKSLSTSLFITAQEIGTGLSAALLSLLVAVFTGDQLLNKVHLNIYTISLITIAVILPPAMWMFCRSLNNSD